MAWYNVIGCTSLLAILQNAKRTVGRGDDMMGNTHPSLHPNTTARTIITRTTARITSKQHAFPLAAF